ncbi:MAG: SH3 domain-containing protein [Caldilineae bacterium]|nr:MAG: SH3 domain-containing protein [Caldilineae bacterium]
MNVRAGPGTNYPIVGSLESGAQARITGKNPQGDWWEVEMTNGAPGWVYGPLVETSGATDGVAVAAAIPTPPPATPTPIPAPTDTPAPTQPPQPQEEWSVTTRLRPIGQDAQSCHGGENSIYVYVQDVNGAPLNGVRVKEVFTGRVLETGQKGPGIVQYDIYRGGGGQVQLVDGAGNPISPMSEGMSADWPPFHMMWDAGYCNCKPHPDAASCEADLNNKQYLFAVGHYTYEVIFRRNH